MSKFLITTSLDLIGTRYKSFGGKFIYDENFIFSFFGYTVEKPKLQNVLLKLSSITKISYYNVKLYNKKGEFTDIKRCGTISTTKSVYHTDAKYITDLKDHYLRGKCKVIKKKLIKDRTKLGVIKKKYDIEYIIE